VRHTCLTQFTCRSSSSLLPLSPVTLFPLTPVTLPCHSLPSQVIELSQQNTQLEEEAFSLEQKLGEAENAVEEGQKKVAELSKRLASGADGSKELREQLKTQEVRVVQGLDCWAVAGFKMVVIKTQD
jgi:predicted  nucleic acid-binding Zn-ribbon protein